MMRQRDALAALERLRRENYAAQLLIKRDAGTGRLLCGVAIHLRDGQHLYIDYKGEVKEFFRQSRELAEMGFDPR